VGQQKGKGTGDAAGVESARTVDLRALGTEERDAAIDRAAGALNDGALVGLPTETVYGVAGSAAAEAVLERLWRAVQPAGARAGPRPALAWHLPTPARAIEALGLGTDRIAQRRAIERLAPGPVTFAMVADGEELDRLCRRTGAVRGAFEDSKEALVRIPAQATARALLGRTTVPLVVAAVRNAGAPARTAREAAAALRAAGHAAEIDSMLEDGSAALGKQSTLVRLGREGSIEVAREGALEGRYIRKRLERVILFVCSGNTCRSPMAAAIARHQLAGPEAGADEPGAIATRVGSAGTSADERGTTTPESIEALRALGVEMRAHPSRALTREQISEAEVIYAMTRSHADAVLAMDPSAADRVMLLDPDGSDIADPIGQGARVYEETARHLYEAVRRRLAELNGREAGQI